MPVLSNTVSLASEAGLDRDLPSGPVVGNLPPIAGGAGSIPSQGNKVPHTLGSGQKKKKKKEQEWTHWRHSINVY